MQRTSEREPKDEILTETRRIKEELARSMGFDVARIVEDAREKQASSGGKIVAPPAKKPR